MFVSMLPTNILAEELTKDAPQTKQEQSFNSTQNIDTENKPESEFIVEGFTYRIISESLENQPGSVKMISFIDVRDVMDPTYGVVIIPETVEFLGLKYKVVSIDGDTFDETLALKSIIVPDSVISIGEKLFENKDKFLLYCNEGSYIENYLKEQKKSSLSVISDSNEGSYIQNYNEIVTSSLISVQTDGVVVTIEKNEITLGNTTKVQLTKLLQFLENVQIKWESSDPQILTVDSNGIVTAKAEGSASITAEIAGLKSTVVCTVKTPEIKPEEKTETSLQEKTVQTISTSVSDINDFVISNGVLTAYNGNSTEVIIPEEVTEIGEDVFNNNQTITSVQLSSGLKKIGDYVFNNCPNLETLTFTGSVPPTLASRMGPYDNFFMGVYGLKNIWVPNGAYSVYQAAYRDFLPATARIQETGNDEKFVIENGVLTAYKGAETEVIIPEEVTEIGADAFYRNQIITHVQLPSGLKKIGARAFKYCVNLTDELVFPESLTEIGEEAYFYCPELRGDLKIPGGVSKINKGVFFACSKLTGNLSLSEGVTEIGESAFSNCWGLSGSLVLPESLTNIGDGAFTYCSGFTQDLLIPNNVTQIDAGAFYGCRGLANIIVGKGMERLNSRAFDGCTGVKILSFIGDVPPTITINNGYSPGIYFLGIQNLQTIYCSPVSLEAYKTAYQQYVGSNVTFSPELSFPVQNLNADKIYSKRIKLSWEAPVSISVSGYHIYRNGSAEPIAVTTNTTYVDTVPVSGETYHYTVCGYTDDGKETSPVNLDVVPKEPEIIAIATNNLFHKIGISDNTLYANVKDTKNLKPLGDEKTVGTFYYLDENGLKTQIGEVQTTYQSIADGSATYAVNWDIANVNPSTYTVIFELKDVDGTTASINQNITIDNSRPEPISALVAYGDTNKIVLSWSIAHEIDTQQYRIYRKTERDDKFFLYKTISDRNTLTFTDDQTVENTKYAYYIVGINSFGQEGLPSKIVVATSNRDTEAPQMVQLNPVAGSIIGGAAEIYAQAIDNVAVVKMVLMISTDEGNTWSELTQSNDYFCRYQLNTRDYQIQKIMVKAIAYDAAGNESSSLGNTYRIDNDGPAKVTGLNYESTATTAVIKWEDVPDQDLVGFRLECENDDGSFNVVQTITSTLGANVTGLLPNTTYHYRVVAYDRRGNTGQYSDVIEVITKSDTTSPVITQILPGPGYFNHQIDLKIKAEDDTAIQKMMIQVSEDSVSWDDVTELPFDGTQRAVIANYNLNLAAYNDGNLFVRAVATDTVGNRGDATNAAPYVQYIIDHATPGVPQNVAVAVDTGAIEISWVKGEESDINGYVLYRSEDGENYSVLADNLQSINYWDRNVEKDKKYWYQVAVKDYAGNVSEKSQSVNAELKIDTIAPVIESCLPSDGSILGPGSNQFSVLISDNWRIKSVEMTYTINDNTENKTLVKQTDVADYYKVINGSFPIENLNDKDRIKLTIQVEDIQGLMTKRELQYVVDKTAPVVKTVSAGADSNAITITWTGAAEADLAGYRIYRHNDNQSYELIGQRSVREGITNYTFTDESAVTNRIYQYKVEAIDKVGNTNSIETNSVWLEVIPIVKAALQCDLQQEVNVEYVINAVGSRADLGVVSYEFNFGDGEIKASTDAKVIHRYNNEGTYTLTLKVTDTQGKTDTTSKEITVSAPQLLGTVRVKTVDASGNPLVGIPIYFDIDQTTDNTKSSNVSGEAVFVSTAEQRTVGAYADGYLPVKKSVIVRANTETEIILTLVKQPIVTGEFEINRMTLDEIKAAGIDVSDPANQQMMKVNIHLEYGSKPLEMSMMTNGSNLNLNNIMIIDSDSGKRKITASVVPPGTGGTNGGGTFNEENVIIALMDVPAEASFLKEFFDVKLHIINHANQEFNLTNNKVTLNVPEGMSIVQTAERTNPSVVTFDQLAGQEEKTIDWLLRGDKAGEYDLTADYESVLAQFNQPVKAQFKTKDPLVVYGTTGIKLIAEINSTIREGALYFNLGLENTNGVDLNLPTLDIPGEIIQSYEKDKENDAKEASVKLLNTMLKNKNGYQQNLGTEQIPTILHVGETWTKKYVAYNAIESNDVAYLYAAIKKTASDLGIEVEIRNTNMDLYDMSLAEDKVMDIRTDESKKQIYYHLLDNENDDYGYIIQARANGDNELAKWGEALYSSFDLVLNLDLDVFTKDEMEEITRNAVCDLLVDESFSQVVDYSIDDSYIKITKLILASMGGALKEDGVEESTLEILNNIAKDGNTVRELGNALKTGGDDAFYERLLKVVATQGGSFSFNVAITGFYQDYEIAKWFGDAIGDECSQMSSVVGSMGKVTSAWNTSAELTRQMITINANQKEALFLLDTFYNSPYLDSISKAEVGRMREALNGAYTNQSKNFENELINIVRDQSVEILANKILTELNKACSFKVGSVYNTMGLVFNLFDYTFDWSGQVSTIKQLRVYADLTLAMKDSMSKAFYKNDGEDMTILRSLKYLIKIRLNGEKAYIESAKKHDNDRILNAINNMKNNNVCYVSLDAYYEAFSNQILSERDILFNTTYSIATIPEAPEVAIDYRHEETAQSFGAEYEYSFDGVNWVSCFYQKINLEPGATSQFLWVRQKASAFNVAGNITKIIIPKRNRIADNISVKFKNGNYYISGLADGDYKYLTSDEETAKMTDSGSKILVENNEATIENPLKSFLILRKEGDDTSFAGLEKACLVEKPYKLSIDSNHLCGTIMGAGEYFPNETANLKATPGAGYNFIGWYKNNELFSINNELDYVVNTNDITLEARFEASGLENIRISQLPKVNYKVGEPLDITGLVVTGTYADGSTRTESVTVDNITGFDSSKAAKDQVLTIIINGKTATYTVQITGLNERQLGDVDGSGVITAYDALIALQIATNKKPGSEAEIIVADVGKNGTVEAYDALRILQYATGKIHEF